MSCGSRWRAASAAPFGDQAKAVAAGTLRRRLPFGVATKTELTAPEMASTAIRSLFGAHDQVTTLRASVRRCCPFAVRTVSDGSASQLRCRSAAIHLESDEN